MLLSLQYILVQLWMPHDIVASDVDWPFGTTEWGSSTNVGVVTCDLIWSAFPDGVSVFSFSRSTSTRRCGVLFSLPPTPRSFKS